MGLDQPGGNIWGGRGQKSKGGDDDHLEKHLMLKKKGPVAEKEDTASQ